MKKMCKINLRVMKGNDGRTGPGQDTKTCQTDLPVQPFLEPEIHTMTQQIHTMTQQIHTATQQIHTTTQQIHTTTQQIHTTTQQIHTMKQQIHTTTQHVHKVLILKVLRGTHTFLLQQCLPYSHTFHSKRIAQFLNPAFRGINGDKHPQQQFLHLRQDHEMTATEPKSARFRKASQLSHQNGTLFVCCHI